jgi:hypothetical protein
MKRDMDVIRGLLLHIEAMPMRQGEPHFLEPDAKEFSGVSDSPDLIAYNLRLMADAGFFSLTHTQPAGGVGILGLSWHGHEFLDSVRDPEIWRKTKEGAEKAGGFTLDLLGSLAKGLIKTQIEKHTGVKL